MARRRGLDRTQVLDAALAIVDRDGVDDVSLAAVAAALDVRPPSLYSHVDGLDDLLDALTLAATVEFSDALRDSVLGLAGEDALMSFAAAYRRWANDHPGRYELTGRRGGDADDRRVAGQGAVDALSAVLRGYGLEGGDATRAGRSLRAALHGFAELEAGDNLGRSSHDASFAYLVEVFVTAFGRSRDLTELGS